MIKLVLPTVSLPLGMAKGEGSITTAHLINQSISQSVNQSVNLYLYCHVSSKVYIHIRRGLVLRALIITQIFTILSYHLSTENNEYYGSKDQMIKVYTLSLIKHH